MNGIHEVTIPDVLRMGWCGPDGYLSEGRGDGLPIVAMTYGNRKDALGQITAGPTNDQIAGATIAVARAADVPVYAQHEVALAMRLAGKPASRPVMRNTDTEGYIDTPTMAHAVASDLRARGEEPVVDLAAHYRHIGRCVYEFNQAGITIAHYITGLPKKFDHQSNEIWTAGSAIWDAHEVCACAILAVRSRLPGAADFIRQSVVKAKHLKTRSAQ